MASVSADSAPDLGAAARLQLLTRELQDIAGLLTGATAGPPMGANSELTARSVRQLLRLRRLKISVLGPLASSEPAWDMILDLLAARLEGKNVCVSSLCLASNVPQSTAMRWIRRLLDEGVLKRVEDPADSRRSFLELSRGTAEKVESFLSTYLLAGC